jgi:PPOX class probable F420-dependent enzyme
MPAPLAAEIKALVHAANFAALATVMPDGSPQVAVVWVDLEGERILVCTGETSLKARNTRRDTRVGLAITSIDNPYHEAQIRGRVVERRPDRDFAVMDRVSRKYTGKAFPWRNDPANRVVLVVEADRARYVALPLEPGAEAGRPGRRA